MDGWEDFCAFVSSWEIHGEILVPQPLGVRPKIESCNAFEVESESRKWKEAAASHQSTSESHIQVYTTMKVNFDSHRILHLLILILASAIITIGFMHWLEWSFLSAAGFGVTLVCQFNNVLFPSPAAGGGGSIDEQQKEKAPKDKSSNNKKKRRNTANKKMD